MTSESSFMLELAERLDPDLALAARSRFDAWKTQAPELYPLAVLCAVAYPAAVSSLQSDPQGLADCQGQRLSIPCDKARYVQWLSEYPLGDAEEASSSLRRFARRQKLRIALRELLPPHQGGGDFEVTAREISELASALVQVALEVARQEVSRRFGPPLRTDGALSTLAVLGMGKLGGHELNIGSDIDLIFFYDTDEGSACRADPMDAITLHEYWSRVCRKLVVLLDDVTADGFVWRTDLRLRPEGTRGAIVNSYAAMLRYYETWGRLWERAALLRARTIAGDQALGEQLMQELDAFIYRRRVDPSIAEQMLQLVERARVEVSVDAERDLKLCKGGIRDLEMFVQSLQLIWGGINPALRLQGTLDALRRLRSCGFVTDREAQDLDQAYALLRRAEHWVQSSTGLQTHLLPTAQPELMRLSRGLGYAHWTELEQSLERTRERVKACVADLLPTEAPIPRWTALLSALDNQDQAQVEHHLASLLGPLGTAELARDLLRLSERPDSLLGAMTRDKFEGHAEAVLDGLLDSADPEQAAKYLRAFFSRSGVASIYTTLFASHGSGVRRFLTVLGASAFVGDLVTHRPELGDEVLFSPGMPSQKAARDEVSREIKYAGGVHSGDADAIAGALRRAKLRITLEVALADVAEEVSVQDTTQVLSSLADASIEHALQAAYGTPMPQQGFAVIAMGKLGAEELGYGSDLDVIFVYGPTGVSEDPDLVTRHIKRAQKVIRLLSAPHEEGPGFELDTRLRPSGQQGVLVTSLGGFARYHGLSEDGQPLSVRRSAGAAPWERQALVRARVCAGDRALGKKVIALAHAAAFDLGAPEPAEVHRLRLRLEKELGRERKGRLDLKVGRGGLLDIEFAVQVLQMRHGRDVSVRTPSTLQAIDALETGGYVGARESDVLREGYRFLRKLEQRLHIVHATSIHLLEPEAPGLLPLARRMGFRAKPRQSASEQLIERYRDITQAVRRTYLELLGVTEA